MNVDVLWIPEQATTKYRKQIKWGKNRKRLENKANKNKNGKKEERNKTKPLPLIYQPIIVY